MAKVSVNLDDDLEADDNAQKLRTMAAPLPSVSKAKSSALKDAPRVQFSFTNVPEPIKEAFATEAKKRGVTKKELLYECLRAGGIEIPKTSEIDGRRR
ncbi:MAG: hypothetical protein AAFQ24_13650 [Pseudomonadota bacterium]